MAQLPRDSGARFVPRIIAAAAIAMLVALLPAAATPPADAAKPTITGARCTTGSGGAGSVSWQGLHPDHAQFVWDTNPGYSNSVAVPDPKTGAASMSSPSYATAGIHMRVDLLRNGKILGTLTAICS